jgi:hypothetical protein
MAFVIMTSVVVTFVVMPLVVVASVVMAFVIVAGGTFSRIGLQVAFNGVSRTQRYNLPGATAPLEKTAPAAISRQSNDS